MRDTFATLVERKAGDLTVSMALIRDKVPGVASRYVTRDLPSLLENHSPLRQIGGEHSPVLAERRVLGPEDKKRGAPGSIEPGNAFLSASGGDGGELNSEHGPTVADALRDLSIALDRLANILDEVNPNLLEP
jgi:hypothetical protein